jgi:hypothetical protein
LRKAKGRERGPSRRNYAHFALIHQGWEFRLRDGSKPHQILEEVSMAYAHKNSKGQTYFLHGKEVTLRNGRKQRIFYFSRAEKQGESMDSVPQGYKVGENARTGLPFLSKA